MDKAKPTSSFPETRWSVILDACDGKDHQRAERALSEIYAIYWKPLYAYARWLGNPRADAEDLTQTFFVQLLEGGMLDRADPRVGKLRGFLLSCFGRHIHNAHRATQAQKRGGGTEIVRIEDIDLLEEGIDLENQQGVTPDQFYDRQCALALVRQSIDELEREQVAAGKAELFRALRPLLDLTTSGKVNQHDLARELGISYGVLRTTVLRLRVRFREIIRDLVRDTLRSPLESDVNREVEVLRRALEV
jgi:RNA polymerase sigma-70 factor (ECF subfamily)